jgi:glycine hydroxymethyltransferase
MGMNLGHGGHLTHGSPANLSGKLFKVVPYGLNKNEEIDYDEMEKLAIQTKPKLIIGGASAYALRFDWERMSQIAKKVGAYFMVDIAHYSGLVAGGAYPNPVPYADFVTSTTHKSLRGPRGGFIIAKPEFGKIINSFVFPGLQGGPLMHVIAAKAVAFREALKPEFKTYQTQVIKNAQAMVSSLQSRGYRIVSGRTESHVFLVDLRPQKLTGKAADILLGKAHITINKNSIPDDPESPFVTSGIRLGTPAITTRGFKEKEASIVGGFIADVLDSPNDESVIKNVKKNVNDLTKKFPVYGK